MQKFVIVAAIALVTSQAAIAASPISRPLPKSYGSGVTTSAEGAWVSPGFDVPADTDQVVKAGPADTTACADFTDYSKVTWTTFDRWGSFPILRPTDVAGEVRYCVGLRHTGSHLVKVAYDVIGE